MAAQVQPLGGVEFKSWQDRATAAPAQTVRIGLTQMDISSIREFEVLKLGKEHAAWLSKGAMLVDHRPSSCS